MKKSLIISIIFCTLIFNAVSSLAQSLRYGLGFKSFDVVQEKRTSLDLTPAKAFSFPNGFSLSFNLFFHSNIEYNFGYIFHIIGQNERHLDFLVTPEKLTVNAGDKVLAECSLSETNNNFYSFFPFQLTIDIKNNVLNIVIGEKIFSQSASFLKDFRKVKIIFGRCNYPLVQTSDVPNMIIKDIRINDTKGDAIYYWKLLKYTENGVYDELKKHFAKVENPGWLLSNHAFWNKKISFTTLKNPQITYNSDEETIAIADRRSFFTYNTVSQKLIRYDNSSGFVHSKEPNQMIYNPLDSTYYSYCFFNMESRDVAAYNFSDKSWNNNNIREFGCEYWHHNRFISPIENSIYLFGGYGQHKYKSQINKYSFKTGKWEKLQYKDEAIHPRYLSGLGVIDENRILLFGGYGNSSGLQSLSPKNYYDLYQVSLPDLSVKKIWEMKPPNTHFVVANSMIVDTLNKCFYALCFPQNQYETSLSLAKFSMQTPEYKIVSNDIPFHFNDILSYADLFRNKNANELYAITFSSLTNDSLSTVSIYSLSYPPVAETDVYQYISKDNRLIFILAGILILLPLAAIIGYRFVRKKQNKTNIGEFNESPDDVSKMIRPNNGRKKEQAIFLFGEFQVKDKNGNDITGEFSPMLKQLYLIILLNTYKEDTKGIPAAILDETLWPNKPRESTNNVRSVMTSKIRQLFENIGKMNIEKHNLSWIIKQEDDIYCDYFEALSLIRKMDDKKNRTRENVMKLLDIVSFGELLPDLQTEWVDVFKADFANKLIDLLIDVSQQKEFRFSPDELIYLSNALLTHDILNDDALRLKCKALIKAGKNGLAKITYNSFIKHYRILFGTDYSFSFDQIIS